MLNGAFHRTERLIGSDGMDALSSKKVILFGIGGVGSWCAESLVRNGIFNLTIVDSDRVCSTNINRQLMATTKTVGKVKTEALKERLLEINPKAKITALQKIYSAETSESFKLGNFDYIIDAIDSLSNKVHLINAATRTKATLFSSMGAALKVDPTKIKVAEFWKIQGCPLGRILRKRMKNKNELPSKKFLCVYSEEVLENKGEPDYSFEQKGPISEISSPGKPDPLADQHDWNSQKAIINGTFSHITAIFGFTLAGLVTKDILDKME